MGSGGSQHGQGSPPSPWKEAVAGGEQQGLEVSVPAPLQKKGEEEKRSSLGPGRGRMLQPGCWVVSCPWHCLRLRAGDKESCWMLASECFSCHLPGWQRAPQKPACLFCGLTLARRWFFVGNGKATTQMVWLRGPGCFQPEVPAAKRFSRWPELQMGESKLSFSPPGACGRVSALMAVQSLAA